jgi:hypothetical protein
MNKVIILAILVNTFFIVLGRKGMEHASNEENRHHITLKKVYGSNNET